MSEARDKLEKAVRDRVSAIEGDFIMGLADIYAAEEASNRVNETLRRLAEEVGVKLERQRA